MNALTESVGEQAALDWFRALRRRRVVDLKNPAHENAAK